MTRLIVPSCWRRSHTCALSSGSMSQSVGPPPSPSATPCTTVVTRISSFSNSSDSDRPSASSPAFVTVYTDWKGKISSVASDDVFTMSPPPAARSSGIAARHV